MSRAFCKFSLIIMMAFVLSYPAMGSADASVTFVFSGDVRKALKKAGLKPKAVKSSLKRRINMGLNALAKKKNKHAIALVNGGQKIRIICFGSKESRRLGHSQGFLLSPGEATGAFDKNGNPIKGGRAVVSIDCEKLGKLGLYKPFFKVDPRTTGFNVIVHELLHTSNKARKHKKGADSIDLYDQFVDAFDAALKAAEKAEKELKEKEERKEKKEAKKQARKAADGKKCGAVCQSERQHCRENSGSYKWRPNTQSCVAR